MNLVVDDIVGVVQHNIHRMGTTNALSRPLRGCSTTTTAPRLVARTTVRTSAPATSGSTPVSVGRCSGNNNLKSFAVFWGGKYSMIKNTANLAVFFIKFCWKNFMP